jgi:hypothetical protein
MKERGYDDKRAIDVAYSTKRLQKYGCGPRKTYTSPEVKKCMKTLIGKDDSVSEESAYKRCSKKNT